jgi:hypothetical protein
MDFILKGLRNSYNFLCKEMEFVSFFVEGLFFKINIFGVLVIMHMKSFHIEMCAQIINTNDVPKVYSSMIV